jgi:glycosyltransferase involved in cell wall biosynthesis
VSAGPDLSLVITCHEQHQYLHQLIAVVEDNFDLPGALEIIVVDSSVTEMSLPAYIRYKRIDNNGPSAARNTGAAMATGQWLMFCDADDIVNPLAIKQVKELSGDADAVFFNFIKEEDTVILNVAENYYASTVPSGKLEHEIITDPVFFLQKFFPVHAVIFRKEIFNKIRFNEAQWFIEDIRLYLELAFLPGVKMKYYQQKEFCSFHRYFSKRISLSGSNEELFWNGVMDNFSFVLDHPLSKGQRFRLVKIMLLNYHGVNKNIQLQMTGKNSIAWNFFGGLPKLLKNKLLFNMATKVTRAGR